MSGTLREPPARTRFPVVGPPQREPLLPRQDAPVPTDEPSPWRWLLLGCVLAWITAGTFSTMFTWFLCAIPHEMGHATVGCLLGRPSAPAISLGGHAWTGIADRNAVVVALVALSAATGAFFAFRRRRTTLAATFAVLAIALPVVSYAELAEVLISVGGHLGEVAFAAYCFSLVFTGGKTGTPQERTAAAFAGALVQAVNVKLCFGLMTSQPARDHYGSNGSLGMKNDYLVLAEDLLHCKLQSVAGGMMLASLAVPLVGLGVGLWVASRDDA